MSNSFRANLELGVNIVIAIAIVVVAGIVVKRHFSPDQMNRGNLQLHSQVLKGTRMNIPDVDWEQNKKSLVLFLKKDCTYCTSSAPLYRQLIADASQRNVKSLAILPDSVEEGRNYINSLDLPIEDVRSGSLPSYKIAGTPTVLFVDHQGTVKSVWVGAVPGREKEMRDELVALFEMKVSARAPAKSVQVAKSARLTFSDSGVGEKAY